MPVAITDRDILKLASISAILPSKSNFSFSRASQDAGPDSDPVTLDVEQRSILFFDERLRVIVVLSLADCDERSLQSLLSRLDITLELWASSEGEIVTQSSNNPESNRDLIWSQRIKHDGDPFVLLTQDDSDNMILNLAWETTVTVQRPRARLVNTHITVIPHASVRSGAEVAADNSYLEPFTTPDASIFEAMYGAPGFERQAPYLAISRIQPVSQSKSTSVRDYRIKSIPVGPVKVMQAVATRLKYTKAFGESLLPAMTASLEIEMLSLSERKGKITEVDMTLATGSATQITSSMLPIDCQSRDCVTLLFNLEAGCHPNQLLAMNDKPSMDVLTVTVRVILSLPQDCTPELLLNWTTNVDFASIQNSLSAGGNQNLQRANRPPSLLLESATQAHLTTRTFFQSLSISISAPISAAKVGVPFIWKLLVVNNSSQVSQLAIIPLPRLQRSTTHAQQSARRHASKASNISISQRDKSKFANIDDMAPACVDENIIYAMQHSGVQSAETEIISLTPELTVGPLGPGQCHEDEIRLVAYKAGVFTFDAIRIIDLIRNQEEGFGSTTNITDLRELPDIVAEQ